MQKFNDSMKEDSDRVYKYSLINLGITFLPPGFLETVDISGISFSADGIDILQRITAIIVFVQTLSFLVSLSINRHSILADSSRILTAIEDMQIESTKNVHSGKNYYERAFVTMDRVRAVIFFIQTALPIFMCTFCLYFSFFYQTK